MLGGLWQLTGAWRIFWSARVLSSSVQSYCIVVAQSTNASEMENPARAQQIANAISDAMAGTSIRALRRPA